VLFRLIEIQAVQGRGTLAGSLSRLTANCRCPKPARKSHRHKSLSERCLLPAAHLAMPPSRVKPSSRPGSPGPERLAASCGVGGHAVLTAVR
jgi:hypothetical protein